MFKRSPAPILALLVLATMRSAAAEIDKTFHERFDVVPGDVLELVYEDGAVDIEPWDQNVLDVTVRYRASIVKVGIGSAREFEAEFRKTGNVIHVGEKRGSPEVMIGFHSENVHEHVYRVRAPAWLKLELDGEDGDVLIRNWRGETRCRIEDGDLDVEGFAGTIEIDAEDGRLNVSDSSGPLRIRSEDGDVAVLDHVASAIHVRASDADVQLDLRPSTTPLDMDVQTEDGDVSVHLEKGISAALAARGGEGQVRVDLPGARNLKTSEREVSATLGDGTGHIRIVTVDGAIAVKESAPQKLPGTH